MWLPLGTLMNIHKLLAISIIGVYARSFYVRQDLQRVRE